MKRLLYFLAGVIAGVVVVLYKIYGRAVQPTVVKHGVIWRYVDFDELMPEYDERIDDPQPIRCYANGRPKGIPWREAMASLDKTQPIKVEVRWQTLL